MGDAFRVWRELNPSEAEVQDMLRTLRGAATDPRFYRATGEDRGEVEVTPATWLWLWGEDRGETDPLDGVA